MIEKKEIENADHNSLTSNTEYYVQTVIRRKFIFSKRSKPIVIYTRAVTTTTSIDYFDYDLVENDS